MKRLDWTAGLPAKFIKLWRRQIRAQIKRPRRLVCKRFGKRAVFARKFKAKVRRLDENPSTKKRERQKAGLIKRDKFTNLRAEFICSALPPRVNLASEISKPRIWLKRNLR